MHNKLTGIIILSCLVLGQGMSTGFAKNYDLDFAKAKYATKTAQVQGKEITYRAYEGIVYVKHPVDLTYQTMNIYVPENYFEHKTMGQYSAATAPIFLPNTIGGYMPGAAGTPGIDNRTGKDNAALVALSKGLVVAEPGARGRTNKDAKGLYTGKAPAAIVDLKAAVRYLRLNDKKMPGSAERIISNGTSAGGAMSSLLAASGNNKDYEPYLSALGAAKTRDDIFAASIYCPITNLENADKAYEWYFDKIYTYERRGMPGMMPSPGGALPTLPPDFKPKLITGSMTASQIELSKELAPTFPAYVNSLNLMFNGKPLTIDANGNGSFKNYLKGFVMTSAQKEINKGMDLSKLTWLKTTEQGKKVTDIDFSAYVKYVKRMKTTPAFDGVDLSNGENDEFGTATIPAQHFTEFSYKNSTVKGTMADEKIIHMMNPMNYLAAANTVPAKYWRIRHGAIDSDTALVIPLLLATKASNCGYKVDFAVPWGQGHGGDYDLDELFDWIEKITK